MEKTQGKHFVLVHGACHGAWSWYKLRPLLETEGHTVTTLDLAASGIDMRKLEQLTTFEDYSLPLMEFMESLPQEEKVILVGHSLGGMNLGLAMEKYPHKIYVAVFLAAFMPHSLQISSYVIDQYINEWIPTENWLDTQLIPTKPLTTMFFGPKFLAQKLYQLCSPQDLSLARSLIRPSSLFLEDLSKTNYFTDERYGSVKRVYIVCTEDKGIPLDFQLWQIQNIGVTESMEIKDADHMPMLSTPKELCGKLMEIADTYN